MENLTAPSPADTTGGIDELLTYMDAPAEPAEAQAVAFEAPAAARLGMGSLMRKIPVTLTLELGSTRVSLEDLAHLSTDSVVELDALAGEPLTIKVNGVSIGKAVVVISGENYGLKVVEISDLNLDSLAA
ncbi:FliM/FliN family flagellar motor switch protein [Hydrogenophaga sp.]|uniref:FliM/FliN family flagellar motor switch protein n=1 Tax=Hydrogenophaga sp. TaxID=1904254 RepID=UPI00261D2E7E|nr:FliM/FliN family flagellar motor switch protein [Hydrogenophaga sp.]